MLGRSFVAFLMLAVPATVNLTGVTLCHRNLTGTLAAHAITHLRPQPRSRVSLDVSVLDSHDRPVVGLTAEEFHLLENGLEQKIESVGPSADANLFVGLLFDVSRSRSQGTRAEEAKQVSIFLHGIWRPSDTGFVLAFGEKVQVVVAPTKDLAEIDRGLDTIARITPVGATALYDAVCSPDPQKLSSFPDQKVFLIFSDMEDNMSKANLQKAIECAWRGGVRLFSVVVEDQRPFYSRRAMKEGLRIGRKLAEATGGEVLDPESRKKLPEVLQRLRKYLSNSYRLTYTPREVISAGKPVKIELRTTRKHLKVLAAKGCFASSQQSSQ